MGEGVSGLINYIESIQWCCLVPTDAVSARIIPNKMGGQVAPIHTYTEMCMIAWGAWMWGADDVHMEKNRGVSTRSREATPRYPQQFER